MISINELVKVNSSPESAKEYINKYSGKDEIVSVRTLDLFDPNEFPLIWDIFEAIRKFNADSDEELQVKPTETELELYLNGSKITAGDDFDILKRIKQLIRENGIF